MKPKEFLGNCTRELHTWDEGSIDNAVDLVGGRAEESLRDINMVASRDSIERAARAILPGSSQAKVAYGVTRLER